MSTHNDVEVCVGMITYKHEAFIAQAIDSIISQKTTFRFKLIIAEDFGKDRTLEICEAYAKKYPDKIELLPGGRNYGMIANFNRTLLACNAKYTAVCEGDDYWTDPYKLQKQYDFMEANPDFSMCFTASEVINDAGVELHHPFSKVKKDIVTIEDLIFTEKVFIPTATIFYRNPLPNPLPLFFTDAISGDIGLHLIMADKGKIKGINEQTAIYRQHAGGISKSKFAIDNSLIYEFVLFERANAYYEYKYNNMFRKQLHKMSKTILIYGSKHRQGIDKVRYFFSHVGKYFKYQDGIDWKEFFYFITVIFFPWLLKARKAK